jgi:DNA-binding transcriptional ArsR family regulator
MYSPTAPDADLHLDIAPTAKFFRGLGDPSRLGIAMALVEGPRSVTEIVRRTGLSQPNASMHLACMRCCGLVAYERRGRRRFYRLVDAETVPMLQVAERIVERARERISSCQRYEAK